MIKSHAKTSAEMRQGGQRGVLFVGPNGPFVGRATPLITPFVPKKRPFVCIGRQQQGLTLVELIITLVVAAILLTLAAPNLSSFLKRDRLATQANDLVADLALARSEAIKRGGVIVVCKSSDPMATPPSCNTTDGDPWTTGRLIWADANGDNTVQSTEVLRIREALDGNSNGLYGENGAAGTANQVRFTGLGMASPPNTMSQLVFCDNRGPSEGRAVVIGPTGRARVTEKGKDLDGNPLDAADCS
jgi:type IV fimbrial biogenesis protein FimT